MRRRRGPLHVSCVAATGLRTRPLVRAAEKGMVLDGNSLRYSLVQGNGVGIRSHRGWGRIVLNEILSNGVGLEVGSYWERPEIKSMALVDGLDTALVYVGGRAGRVDATQNW